MAPRYPYDSTRGTHVRDKLAEAWRTRTLSFKAVSFALIGLVNTAIDYSVFLLAQAAYDRSAAALATFAALAASCRCGAPPTLLLIGANITSWIVAVSASYIMNSSITFAAESGRRLRWRHYLAFIVCRRRRAHRQYGGPGCSRANPAVAGLCSEGLGHPGELRRQFLAVAFCRLSPARAIVSQSSRARRAWQRTRRVMPERAQF